MLAIGIDTSSMAGSTALVDDADLHAELNLRAPVTHSERLLSSIRSLMETAGRTASDLDLIAVACGPGSFTGLRIGMATAKGLGLAAGRPVVGFSTLETIAVALSTIPVIPPEAPIGVLLDAGRGEVYRGLFRCHGFEVEALEAEAALPPAEAISGLPENCVICGSGLAAYRDLAVSRIPSRTILVETEPFIGATLARRALDLAARRGVEDLPPLVPNYLRLSDAERTFGR